MHLVSATHHYVYRNGRTWVKRPYDTSTTAITALSRDADVHQALGRNATWDGRELLLEHLGDPIHQGDDYIPEAAGILRCLHTLPPPASLPTAATWRQEVTEKTRRRLADQPDALAWALRALDVAGPPPPESGRGGIVLTDPHAKNWVRDAGGALQPLDFETALCAPLVVSLACLAHTAEIVEGLPVPDDLAAEAATPLGRWSYTVKGVSGMSWLALARRTDEIYARIALLEVSPYWAGGKS